MNGQYFPNCDSQFHNYDMKKIESKIQFHISLKYTRIYIYVYIAVGGLDVQIFFNVQRRCFNLYNSLGNTAMVGGCSLGDPILSSSSSFL